jgi:pimeloyl-ACP methyl ester carboxylesterase
MSLSQTIASLTVKNKPLIPTKRVEKTRSRRTKLAELVTQKEGFAKSADGTKIWYKSVGSGVPLVFCNGLGCSTFYWKHIHAHFKGKAQVVLLDWRAHGESKSPSSPDAMTIEHLTEDLNCVLNELKLKKAVLLGHSMGIQVLFDFYQNHPKRVMALIPCFGTFGNVMDTFYNLNISKYVFEVIYLFNHMFPKASLALGSLATKNPFWYQIGGLLQMLNPGLADRKVLKEYLEHFTSIDPILLSKLTRSMQDYNAESILKTIKAPTLIVAGEKDQFTPVWLSKKMHRLIPRSELMIMKKATHVGLIEQPELINLRIEKFLAERLGKRI